MPLASAAGRTEVERRFDDRPARSARCTSSRILPVMMRLMSKQILDELRLRAGVALDDLEALSEIFLRGFAGAQDLRTNRVWR